MSLSARRAWIEISRAETAKTSNASLSARRAWIEIRRLTDHLSTYRVALRKESVDRNYTVPAVLENSKQSLSARRAWIEIRMTRKQWRVASSLSARRAWIEIIKKGRARRPGQSRSPQGERG